MIYFKKGALLCLMHQTTMLYSKALLKDNVESIGLLGGKIFQLREQEYDHHQNIGNKIKEAILDWQKNDDIFLLNNQIKELNRRENEK